MGCGNTKKEYAGPAEIGRQERSGASAIRHELRRKA